jgi:hypothetical protein
MRPLAAIILILFIIDVSAQTRLKQTLRTYQYWYKPYYAPSTHNYLEYLPPGYESSDEKFPLLIYLHGSGEGQSDNPEAVKAWGPPRLIEEGHNMCFTVDGKEECFIVISPHRGNSTELITALIGHLLHGPDNYKVDPERIYLTGISQGGWTVYTYAGNQNDPNQLAAIAPIAAKAEYEDTGCKISAKQIPVWAFHGRLDTVVPYSYGLLAFNNIAFCTTPTPTAELKLTTYPDRYHDSWIPGYDTGHDIQNPNLYEWLLTKRLPAPIVTSTEASPSTAFGIAPNPVLSTVTLSYDDQTVSDQDFMLYTVTGQILITIKRGARQADLSSLKPGVYFFQYHDRRGIAHTERLMKLNQ